jgi:hypothetical protein
MDADAKKKYDELAANDKIRAKTQADEYKQTQKAAASAAAAASDNESNDDASGGSGSGSD